MSTPQRILATFSFLISLGSFACDGIDVAGHVQAAPHQPIVALEDSSGEGCGCGNYVDVNRDGGCDRAASGECRRGRSGRCPCGAGCAGCS
jgi:hypothetical protein